jgi:dihydrofolate synthase/folylpolyglutamate synthase
VEKGDFSYQKWISESYNFGTKPGLDRIRAILKLLGDPQNSLQYVHIAGTNGKGSTASYINNVLMKAGYKTGLYTSPGIHSINDRVCVNNRKIDDETASQLASRIKEAIDIVISNGFEAPTQFEIITCIAFLYFNLVKCDIVVLETGLGGRLDATNVIEAPEVAVLTTINYDHMHILGNTFDQIAREKAAIIKKDCIAVCYDNVEEVNNIFHERCLEIKAEFRKVDFKKIHIEKFDINGQVFNYKDYHNVYTEMLGKHQSRNASVAIEACVALQDKGFNISYENIIEGIKSTSWEGRMEVVKRRPVLIIDGAHNAEGVDALVNNLKTYFPGKKIIFVLGMLDDKDVVTAIRSTEPVAAMYIAVSPDNARAIPAEKLAGIINEYCNNAVYNGTIKTGIEYALKSAGEEDVICVFGSLYMIDEVKKYTGR